MSRRVHVEQAAQAILAKHAEMAREKVFYDEPFWTEVVVNYRRRREQRWRRVVWDQRPPWSTVDQLHTILRGHQTVSFRMEMLLNAAGVPWRKVTPTTNQTLSYCRLITEESDILEWKREKLVDRQRVMDAVQRACKDEYSAKELVRIDTKLMELDGGAP